MKLAALIAACLATIADAYTTRAAILSGNGHEANPLRAWLMDRLGLNGGTYGVALAICVFFVFAFLRTADGSKAVFSFVAIACVTAYVAWQNWKVAKRR